MRTTAYDYILEKKGIQKEYIGFLFRNDKTRLARKFFAQRSYHKQKQYLQDQGGIRPAKRTPATNTNPRTAASSASRSKLVQSRAVSKVRFSYGSSPVWKPSEGQQQATMPQPLSGHLDTATKGERVRTRHRREKMEGTKSTVPGDSLQERQRRVWNHAVENFPFSTHEGHGASCVGTKSPSPETQVLEGYKLFDLLRGMLCLLILF